MEEEKTQQLWAHQKEAIKRASSLNCFALLFEPGTGKSRTVIEMLKDKYRAHNRLLPTLIFCPPVAISNWKNEWLKFSKVQADRIIPLVGTGDQRWRTLVNADRNSIFITNYETLLMQKCFEEFCRFPEDSCLVLDESHKIKSMSSKRTKAAIRVSAIFTYRYLLTGTPILNNLMDVFSQWAVLDQGRSFGGNFFSFRARYFYDKNAGMNKQKYFPDWRPRPGAAEEIKEIMSKVSAHAEKAKCLDLPDLVRKTVFVEMGKEQKRLYQAMKQDLIATIQGDDGKLKASIAELAITKALRLQQIASGFLRIVGEDGEDVSTISLKDNPRKQALKELLEDLAPNHKTIVWAVFQDNYKDVEQVCEDLKLKYVSITGLVKDKAEAAKIFNDDPETRVLIGHPGAGGIGINLVAASYSIYYSRSFSLEFDIQSEARNHRGGSEIHEKITRIDLVTAGTIDELVLKSLANKQALSDAILKENLHGL